MSTTEEQAKRGHVLVITTTEDHHPGEQDDYAFKVECLAPALCGGWESCAEAHVIEDDAERDDAESEGVHEFHGVEHTYMWGYDWTVPFPGCIVADRVGQWDAGEWEIAREHGAGRHVVEDDWDDTSLILIHVETLEEA